MITLSGTFKACESCNQRIQSEHFQAVQSAWKCSSPGRRPVGAGQPNRGRSTMAARGWTPEGTRTVRPNQFCRAAALPSPLFC